MRQQCFSHRNSICLFVTRMDQSKNGASYHHHILTVGCLEDSIFRIHQAFFINSKMVALSNDAKWEGVGENLWFLVNKSPYLRNCDIGPRLQLITNWHQWQWPWMAFNAQIGFALKSPEINQDSLQTVLVYL